MVNVGKANGFFPGNLMELVNRNIHGTKPVIGRIDLMPGYTLFDVKKEDAHRVLDALKNTEFFGDRIHAEIATDRDYASDTRGRRGKSKDKKRGESKSSRSGKKGGPKSEKGSREKERKNQQMYDYALDLLPESVKKAKKSKKEKQSKKAKYNGNYDIFMNK